MKKHVTSKAPSHPVSHPPQVTQLYPDLECYRLLNEAGTHGGIPYDIIDI